MLKLLRNLANNSIFRWTVLLILASLLSWGAIDAIRFNNVHYIVTFGKKLPNIGYAEFMQTKKQYLARFGQQPNLELQSKEMQAKINELVIGNLIKSRILGGIATEYHLSFDQADIFNYVVKSSFFNDKQGNFDQELFNNSLQRLGMREQEYLAMVNEELRQKLLITSIINSAFVSPVLIKEITDYLQENRLVDLVRLKLDVGYQAQKADIEQLKEFYNQNLEKFRQPEKFNLIYSLLTVEQLSPELKITPIEIKEFIEHTNSKLTNSEASKQLQQQKFKAILQHRVEQIEDDIASGNTIQELSAKYHLPLKHVSQLSLQELKAKELLLKDLDFTLQTAEIPYLIELPENKGMLIIVVDKVFPSYIAEFIQVQEQVKQLWAIQESKKVNLTKITEFAKKSSAQNLKALAKKSNFEFIEQKQLSRSEGSIDLPPDLLQYLFMARVNQLSPVFYDQKYAYIGKVSKIQTKPNAKISADSIESNIVEGYLQEIISYFADRYKIKVKLPT